MAAIARRVDVHAADATSPLFCEILGALGRLSCYIPLSTHNLPLVPAELPDSKDVATVVIWTVWLAVAAAGALLTAIVLLSLVWLRTPARSRNSR
jgi:hypothetical protein